MSATIFTVANQKGGVGKTTTVINLGAALAQRVGRTLIIDLDPQANATSGLGIERKGTGSILGPISGEVPLGKAIMPTAIRNLSIIPSEIDLAAAEIELAQRSDYLVQLRRCLEPLKDSNEFEVVIVDCPPALGLLSMNGLAAADHLLIALQCEYYAMEGLSQILSVVEQLREAGANQSLEIGGIIMTMYDARTNLSKQLVEEVRQHFPEPIFNTLIPRSIRLSEAPSFGESIFQYDPLGPGAIAYKHLSFEVIDRFGLK